MEKTERLIRIKTWKSMTEGKKQIKMTIRKKVRRNKAKK